MSSGDTFGESVPDRQTLVFRYPVLFLSSAFGHKFYNINLLLMLFVQELNSEPVIPEGFPEWKETMDSWGYKMISAIEVSHLSTFSVVILSFFCACLY